MKYLNELNEIRNLINAISSSDNYASKLDDEELSDGVTYLKTKDTGLSCDIIVDCGETYKLYNHPLCVYIVNGNDVEPVVVSSTPFSPKGKSVPTDVASFIQNCLSTLTGFANLKIDGGDFYDVIEGYKEARIEEAPRLVVEMSNYGPDKTGLPIWVYVDDTNSYLKSGHNGSYRMKFQQDKDVKNPRLWMPITIPDLTILEKDNIPPCKESSKNINLVLQWAKGNLNLLIQLRDGEITGADFKQSMKTMAEIKVIIDSEC